MEELKSRSRDQHHMVMARSGSDQQLVVSTVGIQPYLVLPSDVDCQQNCISLVHNFRGNWAGLDIPRVILIYK